MNAELIVMREEVIVTNFEVVSRNLRRGLGNLDGSDKIVEFRIEKRTQYLQNVKRGHSNHSSLFRFDINLFN
jgi:hypothetical protein